MNRPPGSFLERLNEYARPVPEKDRPPLTNSKDQAMQAQVVTGMAQHGAVVFEAPHFLFDQVTRPCVTLEAAIRLNALQPVPEPCSTLRHTTAVAQ